MDKLDNFTHTNIEVFSFLKKKGIESLSLQEVINTPNDYFIKLDEMTEKDLLSILNQDSFYIEGGICLNYQNKNILGYQEWDLLDQLWSYFLAAFVEIIILKKNESQFHFPDQPLEVMIKDLGYMICIKIGTKEWVKLPKIELCSSFILEAKKCFMRIGKSLNSMDTYQQDFENIKLLEDKLSINHSID